MHKSCFMYSKSRTEVDLLTYSSSFPLEHRGLDYEPPSFSILSCLLCLLQVMLMVLSSACRVLFHVRAGLPLFRFPWGFQSKAWRMTLVCSLRRVCPIHFIKINGYCLQLPNFKVSFNSILYPLSLSWLVLAQTTRYF